MLNPLIDPKDMTEKQIYDKMEKIQKRIAIAGNYGLSYQIVDQLRNSLAVYQFELYNRSIKVEDLGQRGEAWNMDAYVEELRNEKAGKEVIAPRWQSIAEDELSSDDDESWDPDFGDEY